VPGDLGFKTMNAVHRGLLWVSHGRLGWRALNMPVLELTTTGRKSGQQRSVMLTSPVRDGDTVVVVASRGGDDRPPAWLLNVQANPSVGVVLQGEPSRRMHARVATPQERARLWPLVVADHTNYADYQKRTSREIALVLLEPPA
jgi:deazaflavin-dependent oxidoreductase (nitroreductase family)